MPKLDMGKQHWFKTWWGISILIVLYAFIVLALAFVFLAWNYWRIVKSGQGAVLQKQFYSQYSKPAPESAEVVAARQSLETKDDPYLGNANAEWVIVEFLDFKCPICKAQAPVLQKLSAKYGYKIKIILRDFPMESVHPGASQLAAIASCAHEQGAFWFFSDYFFANQDTLPAEIPAETIDNLSDEVGIDKAIMRECLASGRGRIEESKDYADAVKNGVNRGTPTYFINGLMVGAGGAAPMEFWEKLFINLRIVN